MFRRLATIRDVFRDFRMLRSEVKRWRGGGQKIQEDWKEIQEVQFKTVSLSLLFWESY